MHTTDTNTSQENVVEKEPVVQCELAEKLLEEGNYIWIVSRTKPR